MDRSMLMEGCNQDHGAIKKGTWSSEEDSQLAKIVSQHGPGRWNSLARLSGLQRSGKSCRLRWLNYLRPNVRHGGFTPEEQILILQLHLLWGNRWARIAEKLPGRTDNDIKNYWRTRILRHAKHLNCDVNSQRFKDTIRNVWIPTLLDRVKSEPRSESCSDSGSESYISQPPLPEGASESVNNVQQPGVMLDDPKGDGCMGFGQAQFNAGGDGNGPRDGPVAVESGPFAMSANVWEDFGGVDLEEVLSGHRVVTICDDGFFMHHFD